MLRVTEAAVGAFREIRRDAGVPQRSGVRIQMMQAAGGQEGIGFAFSEAPERGDQVLREQTDLPVYVAEDLVEPLSRAVLDARESAQGTEFVLRDQRVPDRTDDGDEKGTE